MQTSGYLMESNDEFLRLDLKTDDRVVARQARWAGLKPGMRVLDLGCGSGKTTSVLHHLVQPGGEVIGVDYSDNRIEYARDHYQGDGLGFRQADIRKPLTELGQVDLIWMRFVLEYYAASSFDIVKNIVETLKPGGTLCLIDLDHNCLSHHGHPPRLARTIQGVMTALQEKADFDPYVGRKLYSYLYDLGYEELSVDVAGHHIIYGELQASDAFNWLKKVEIAPTRVQYQFDEYPGGYVEFLEEFNNFFDDPRRFTYSPIICCRGIKPTRPADR